MKRKSFAIIFVVCCLTSLAQQYGKYSLPHTIDNTTLKQYIGKRVKVLHQNVDDKEAWRESNAFESEYNGRELEKEYTIKNIKANKKSIKIDLIDDNNSTCDIEIDATGTSRFGMKNCNSFFLIEDFKNDNINLLGQEILDFNNKPVAKIIDVDIYGRLGDSPQILYTLELTDGSIYLCSPDYIDIIFGKIGSTVSNPKIKHTYLVKGVEGRIPNENNSIFEDKTYYKTYEGTYISKSKEPIAEIGNNSWTKFLLINSATNEEIFCIAKNLETDAFSEDLAGQYVSLLNSVEKPSNPNIRYGETTLVKDDNISKFNYKDNIIDIIIFGTDKQFSFILKNISDSSIKIIWDEAVFVDFDGSSSKIMHKGVKFSQRESEQPPTTLIKGAKLEDIIIPNENVYYNDNKYVNDWAISSMYPKEKALEPGNLKIMIPIQIKDVINEYIFDFEVKYLYKHPERMVNTDI